VKKGRLPAALLVSQTGLAVPGVVAKDIRSIRGRVDQCILEKAKMNKNDSIKKESSRQANIAATLAVPYGQLQIVRGGVIDHVSMRVDQLTAFLLLISGQGQENFADLQNNDMNSLLWMAHSMAQECRDLLPLLAEAKIEVSA
jgi:hypothetical protein